MKRTLWGIAAALFLAVCIGPVACSSDDDAPDSAGIGVSSVDTVIAAINQGDASVLTAQAVLGSIPCTTADGLGGPPKCRPGEPDGTELEVMPAAGCEGYYLLEDEIQPSMDAFVSASNTVEAVYRSGGIRDFYLADYVIVVRTKDPQFDGEIGREVYVNDDGVTGLFFGCGQTVEELIEVHNLEGKLSVAR